VTRTGVERSIDCNGRPLQVDRTVIMGVLNVTPDSFSDGGLYHQLPDAIDRAQEMVAAGADIIDIGGVSTRPGAAPLAEGEELSRVLPVVEALAGKISVPLSIDTSSPVVMRATVEAGAGLINDVCALQRPGALETASELGVPVSLMHMQGTPETMQRAPYYPDVVEAVYHFLKQRQTACIDADMEVEKIFLDPGFGFGKNLEHNRTLLSELRVFTKLGSVLLVGLSRKTMIDDLLGRPVHRRSSASAALALIAAQNGAGVVRVHDVGMTHDAIRVWEAVSRSDGTTSQLG